MDENFVGSVVGAAITAMESELGQIAPPVIAVAGALFSITVAWRLMDRYIRRGSLR